MSRLKLYGGITLDYNDYYLPAQTYSFPNHSFDPYPPDESLWITRDTEGFIISTNPLEYDYYRQNIVQEKVLLSLKGVPEFKQKNCTKTVRVPCPTITNPGRMCNRDVTYPCGVSTRTGQHQIIARMEYPSSASDVVRRELNTCLGIASAKAMETLYSLTTASAASLGTAIPAAIGAAYTAFNLAFWPCVQAIAGAETIRRYIKVNIYHRQTSGDWS